jgi:hypothetical protein
VSKKKQIFHLIKEKLGDEQSNLAMNSGSPAGAAICWP